MRITVNGMSFGYESKQVLKDIDLEARQGSILGIIGQNGCGKTTLLKCINRMLKPQSGSVMVEEPAEGIMDPSKGDMQSVDVSDMDRKELARCMSVVSQNAYISFPYTAFDAVMMGRYARSGGDRRADLEAVYRSMRSAGALEFAKRPVNELSGGELRRVMIARALAQEPKVLLLDEPTLHLDVNHQFDLMELITDLKRESDMIIIMVTHDVMFAARYCDQVIMMEDGRIVAAGDTENVLTSQSIKEVFDVRAVVEYDERIGGLNVVMIGR